DGTATTRIVRNHLRHQEHAVPSSLQRLSKQRLRSPRAVQLRRVYVRQAELQRRVHRSNRGFTVALFQVPSTQPDFRHMNASRAKRRLRKSSARHAPSVASFRAYSHRGSSRHRYVAAPLNRTRTAEPCSPSLGALLANWVHHEMAAWLSK